jgi:hypothetical protein
MESRFSREPCDFNVRVRGKKMPESIPFAKIPVYPSSHEIHDAKPIFEV